ncbi:uncharacterized protein LOC120659581 [Panicum virgatum]|uniref:uncharacterized protein LOC120659581 n=1 Tax=Panicum virgatum TaxID=38727 RepID=UPI0019D67017|nr:uncharacterized protein LOC120659581 [Panicum virgatum]
MALQATEQGSRGRPLPSAADTDPIRRPLALGGAGCSFKRAVVAGLPDDALVEILSRLPAKYLCLSKCVSKAWRYLIADRLRCRKLPLTLEGFFYGCEYRDRKAPFGNEGCCDSLSDSGDKAAARAAMKGAVRAALKVAVRMTRKAAVRTTTEVAGRSVGIS